METALQSARLYDGTHILCYRGRTFVEGNKPGRDEMGPPPVAYEGRYNDAGRIVLYLSESPEGVGREVSTKPEKPVLWVQSFTLKLDALRIADFRLSGLDAFLNHVFWWSETTGSYLFSQLVGGLVAQNFDGMVVPGVRGDQSTQYHNIVIFNSDRWREWLTDGIAPERLLESS